VIQKNSKNNEIMKKKEKGVSFLFVPPPYRKAIIFNFPPFQKRERIQLFFYLTLKILACFSIYMCFYYFFKERYRIKPETENDQQEKPFSFIIILN